MPFLPLALSFIALVLDVIETGLGHLFSPRNVTRRCANSLAGVVSRRNWNRLKSSMPWAARISSNFWVYFVSIAASMSGLSGITYLATHRYSLGCRHVVGFVGPSVAVQDIRIRHVQVYNDGGHLFSQGIWKLQNDALCIRNVVNTWLAFFTATPGITS